MKPATANQVAVMTQGTSMSTHEDALYALRARDPRYDRTPVIEDLSFSLPPGALRSRLSANRAVVNQLCSQLWQDYVP